MSQLFLPAIASTARPPRLRLGVSIAHYRTHEWRDETLRLLNPPLWKDWLWDHTDMPGYAPSVFQMKEGAFNTAAMAKARLDTTQMWELGNEPEQGSSAVAPEVAAAFSRQWQQEVGVNFAAPGIIVGQRGLDWYERYLKAGGVVGVCHNIHAYWCETRSIWADTWAVWCEWMKAHKLLRPTIISETSGEAAPVPVQMEIMAHIAETLRTDSSLDSVIWYSDHDWHGIFHNANLRTVDGALTELGRHYVKLTA